MEYQPYLIFSLGNLRYGIAATAVQELFFVPQIAPIVEAPAQVLGVIDLRGELLPVIDLQRSLGCQPTPIRVTDSVIVLKAPGGDLGLLVNQIHDVEFISPEQVTARTNPQPQTAQALSHLSCGLARLEEQVITLLDPEPLMQLRQGHPIPGDTAGASRTDLFVHFSEAEQQSLRERADNLRQSLDTQDNEEMLPLAVVGIGDEYLGISLETVAEFIDVQRVTPIPCCPSHIVGNMNLRGEIITLVDITRCLSLLRTKTELARQAIVVRLGQLVAGITVDEILDVVYVHPSAITATPVALRSGEADYLQGVAAYGSKLMSVINLPKILTADTLVVNQEV